MDNELQELRQQLSELEAKVNGIGSGYSNVSAQDIAEIKELLKVLKPKESSWLDKKFAAKQRRQRATWQR